MKKFKFLISGLLLSSLFFSCGAQKLPKKTLTITKQDSTQIEVIAEIAKTTEQRNHGFMERKNIPDGTGMLFVFEQEQQLSFWMKNTPHPLSIAYIDSKGTIRDIFDMTPFSLAPILSTHSCKYALEVPQGWFKNNNINVGDKISLNYN